MEIIDVEINKITPDPEQPRKSIDELDLREMAQSIITTGIINPIEVDKGFVIITGERRWRASKIAGLEKIPVRVMDMEPNDRFMRQVIENIHHNTMNDWDTANALKKLTDMYLFHDVKQIPRKPGRPDIGITWLSGKTGKSIAYISGMMDVLEASKPVQKAVKEGKITSTHVRAIRRAPVEFKEAVEKKVLNKEFKSTDGAEDFVAALNRERDNPEIVKKLLETDYSVYKTNVEAREAIAKISPKVHQILEKTYEPAQEISKIVDDLKEWVSCNPITGIGAIHAPRIITNMNYAKTLIKEWFDNKNEVLSLDK